jgi:hypothetical protein
MNLGQYSHFNRARARRSGNLNSTIIKLLRVYPVAFNPELARISKSAIAGLFMSQLLYWWGKGWKSRCVFKSVREFKEEICLSRSEQNRAIKKWKELDILKVENKGLPRTRHFYLNTEKLIELLNKRAKEKGVDGYHLAE